jgi:hypothetical protein
MPLPCPRPSDSERRFFRPLRLLSVLAFFASGFALCGQPSPDTRRGDRVLVYDAYIPTRDTVGVTAKTLSQLSEYNSPETRKFDWTDGGTASSPLVVRDRIIYGEVVRKASHVRFVNCLFRGPPVRPPNETAIVNCHDTASGDWVFVDCTFAPQFPNANLNAVVGHEFKAFRCHAFWVVDGFGVFTHPSSKRDTHVEIAGCLVEYLVYFPGTHYSDATARLLTSSGAYVPAGRDADYVLRKDAQPDDTPWVDTRHRDGNHSDGVQIQGAYGRMTRATTPHPVTGLKPWTGTGVYVHGNAFLSNDAWDCTEDPSGLGLPVPGRPGSLPGSRLGFGDNPKRGVPQSPAMTRPATTGRPLFDGGYAANGSGVLAQQNVNRFPYPDAAHPEDYTVVIAANYFDKYHTAVAVSGSGKHPAIAVALLYNKFGRNAHRYGSAANPQIYPIRVRSFAHTTFAPADDGSDGLATNRWLDPAHTWHPDGTSLRWIPPPRTPAQEKHLRTSGIYFDN